MLRALPACVGLPLLFLVPAPAWAAGPKSVDCTTLVEKGDIVAVIGAEGISRQLSGIHDSKQAVVGCHWGEKGQSVGFTVKEYAARGDADAELKGSRSAFNLAATKDLAGVGDHAWSAFRGVGDIGNMTLVIETGNATLEMNRNGKGVTEESALSQLKALAAKVLPKL